LSCRTFEMSE